MAATYASGATRAEATERRWRVEHFTRFLLGHSAALRAFVSRNPEAFSRETGVDVQTALRVYDTTVGGWSRLDYQEEPGWSVDWGRLAHVADDAEWVIDIAQTAEQRLAGRGRRHRLRHLIASWCDLIVVCRRHVAMARLGGAP